MVKPTEKPLHYAVAGGGLAGMEAALTLKQRGHDVTVYEPAELGGQFNLAHLPPNKESLKEIVDYFRGEMVSQQIPVRKRPFDRNEQQTQKYDGVIIATGSKPLIPKIKGLNEYYWADFLLDENLPENKKVLIIGGGLIGVEMASKLLEKNNQVVLVEMLNELARGMEMIERKITLRKLMNNSGVHIYKEYAVTEVDGKTVTLSGEDERKISEIDVVVVAAGMKSYNPLEEQLKDKTQTWVIGDANKVGKAQDAILSGFKLARRI